MCSTTPKHQKVYTALRHDILIGKYSADGKIPSESMLIRKFGVSRIAGYTMLLGSLPGDMPAAVRKSDTLLVP